MHSDALTALRSTRAKRIAEHRANLKRIGEILAARKAARAAKVAA